MALVLRDRVRESSTSTGTGAMTLLGALPGFQPFSAIGVGNTTYYTITGPEGTWETGVGTLSAASTLQRTTVIESSNGGAKVNFAAGVKDVFVTGPGSKFFVPEWATQAQAEAGTDNTTLMTPLRTAQAIAAAASDVVAEVFTASGTFSKEPDDLGYMVECIGGGASGGSHFPNTGSVAAIGGNGGRSSGLVFIDADSIGSSVSVVVGAGGASVTAPSGTGHVNGNAGGDSSFGSIIAVSGGSTSPSSLSGVNGLDAGAAGISGNVVGSSTIRGGAGGGSLSNANAGTVVLGGVSQLGGNGGTARVNANGDAGQVPGGGGGAAGNTTAPTRASGAGARGEVRVWRIKR